MRPRDRLTALASRWGLTVQRTIETERSMLGFGVARGQRAVLKIARTESDEYSAGRVLDAFDGHGTVRLLEYEPGAALVEELVPATPLSDQVRSGRDDEATRILAHVIAAMQQASPRLDGIPAVTDWARGFDRYLATGRNPLDRATVVEARETFLDLCSTQGPVRLLHGDLHHDNVLHDERRGWVAIDPKGVLGELEYELGAPLRNPPAMPEAYTATAIERRIALFARELAVDAVRVLRWTYAQAMLSAIWTLEDGEPLDPRGPALRVAAAARTVLA